jgi:hypothetical protein
MNDAEPTPQGESPNGWWVHLLVEGEEEINYNHPMYQRWRTKNPPKADPTQKPPAEDGDAPDNNGPAGA